MRWLTGFGYGILQLWARTLRFEMDDRAALVDFPAGPPFIATLWHSRLLFWGYVIRRYLSHYNGAALISASGDGDIIAELVARYGFEIVRGSTSRRGAGALRQLSDILAGGRGVALIPDGPRGPAYRLAGGVIYLAQKSGAPVVPMNLEFSHAWRLKSWDRFMIPRPFSTVRVIFGPRHQVAPTTNEAEFEKERLRLENAMMALVETR